MVARVPPDGTAELVAGSQLVVQDGQLAVFFHDGKPTDGFWPGRHDLSTENLPVLGKLLNLASLGAAPFRSYVCFVALKTFTNLGWGTSTPILFRDSEFKMVNLRAHGAFAIKVKDAEVFLSTIMGSQRIETSQMLEEYLRKIILSHLARVLPETLTTIIDLPKSYQDISTRLKQAVQDEFAQYGVELVDLLVEAITLPPSVQEAINRAAGTRALGMDELQRYERVTRSDALLESSKQPGGTAAQGLTAGLGLAAGMQMVKESANSGGSSAASAAPELDIGALETKLQKLKQLADKGLITQEDYQEQKKRLLAMI